MAQRWDHVVHVVSNGDDISLSPLTRDGPQEPETALSLSPPRLTALDATALLISIQIGSGIFSSPSQVSKHTPGPGVALIVWLVCGLFAWAGATSYAELGTTFPTSGGTQEYLRQMYGDALASLASWTYIFGVKAPGMATLMLIATQYWMAFVFGVDVPNTGWLGKVLATLTFAVIVALNLLGTRTSTVIIKLMAIFKLSAIVLLLLLTFFYLVSGRQTGLEPVSRDWRDQNWFSVTNESWQPAIWSAMGELSLAIYAGLWAYSGWDNVNIVTEDLEQPNHSLPQAIHTSQPMVIVCYILANVCYYVAVPWSDIDSDDTIAVTAGRRLLGWTGSLVFTILVSTACLGAVSVNVFTASRLVVAAAASGWLPQSLESVTSVQLFRHSWVGHRGIVGPGPTEDLIPVRAMLFIAGLASLHILTGSFASLVTFIGLAEYLFFMATTIGLLIMRVRAPHLPRPYKANIVVPCVFSGASACVLLVGIFKAPVQATMLVVLLSAGLASQSGAVRETWGRISQWIFGLRSRGRYTILTERS